MNDKNSEGITRAAEWLLKGAVMLQKACPQCGSPLYRFKDNNVYCAKCKTQVVIIGPNDPIPPEYQTQPSQENDQSRSTPEISQAEKVITKKLQKLTEDLEAADDVDEIVKLTEAIDKLTETIKKLQK
ncbi:MAG: Sjogren's syndrome/scleroderma autoantigen 1 family protein [Candidatus Kariarchaeaceae archaeon]